MMPRGKAKPEHDSKVVDKPLLLLDDEPPLLLDGPEDTPDDKSGADNSRRAGPRSPRTMAKAPPPDYGRVEDCLSTSRQTPTTASR